MNLQFIFLNILVSIIFFELLSWFFLSDYMDSKINKTVHRYRFDIFFDRAFKNPETVSFFNFDNLASVPHPYLGYIKSDKSRQLDIIHEKKDFVL